ncbi:hypothetical protein SISSUDRAFT_817483 [Sistotremastrum suecicum HHB10207 ss-3]|uniref:Uncharacterized protein n=1 Tax=Sistotremastrum suecicum HHB10207 ss-3 TaxID=1314776 RepID=A0A166CV91_9AGAM|nr:hypothetical protein SISSUDRAFT_817483 [Sistotremastrum suecicum HHB10207 ss-3]
MVSPYWQRATLSAVLLALTAAHAIDLSDPSVPCTSGWCAYDTGDGVKTAYSTLILNGSPSSIGDITPAGGWMVSDCPQSWPSGQATIKMSCMQGSSECAKLFSGAGAQNTVVRLPPSCGQGPFARVVSHSSSDSGTNTTSVASKKGKTAEKRAKNNASQVHTMTLDFAFSKIPANSPHGPINMAITSSNVKGPTIDKRWVKQAMRKRGTAAEFHRRGFFSSIANGIDQAVHGVESGIKSVVGDVTSVAKAVATDIKSVASDVTSAAAAVATDIKNGVNTAVHAAENATAFNKTETDNLKPISIQKNFPIINKDLECGPVTGTISLDVDTDVKAQVAFGYVITGTAIPPKLDEFMVMATLNGNVTNTFNVNLGLQGNFDTGSRQLIQTGLPGLSIPGIVTIGPIFSINAELSANFDLEAQMVINTEFDLPNINLVFPPDQGKNSGTESTASGGKQPLKVSLGSGSGTLNGNIDAHLIPRVDFGVEILEGLAKATVNHTRLDTSITRQNLMF